MINALKQEKNAVILAHGYVTPDIIYSVADRVGSYDWRKRQTKHREHYCIYCG